MLDPNWVNDGRTEPRDDSSRQQDDPKRGAQSWTEINSSSSVAKNLMPSIGWKPWRKQSETKTSPVLTVESLIWDVRPYGRKGPRNILGLTDTSGPEEGAVMLTESYTADEELTTGTSSEEYVPLAWREALEMWVDVKQSPATICLAGQLNSWTAGNLVPIVKEILVAGIRDFELRTASLKVADAVGVATLVELRELCSSMAGCSSGTVRR